MMNNCKIFAASEQSVYYNHISLCACNECFSVGFRYGTLGQQVAFRQLSQVHILQAMEST